MPPSWRITLAVSIALIAFCRCGTPAGAATGETLTTHIAPSRVAEGGSVAVSGTLSAPPAAGGRLLELQEGTRRSALRNIAHTTAAADGSFTFPRVWVFVSGYLRVLAVGPPAFAGGLVRVTVIPARFPPARAIGAASRYLRGRAGSKAFAVLDNRGRLSGVDVHRRFHSASVVKSMLLVAYLRYLHRARRGLDAQSRGLLYPMIHSSDNDAATSVLSIVGSGALGRLARDAHMRDYVSGGGNWGFTEVSAADLARFFRIQDRLIPRRFVAYARWLLAGIEPSESWGVPAVARPRFAVFFKGGWLPETEGLVNQAARLERGPVVLAIAVLTRGDPSMTYGERTIEGVTRRLLARRL